MNAAMTNFIIGLEKQRFPSISPRVRRAKRARGQPASGGGGLGRAGCPRARFAHPLRRRGKFVFCLNLMMSQTDMPSVRYWGYG